MDGMRVAAAVTGWLTLWTPGLAQPATPAPSDRAAVLAEYRDFLTIPNVAADPAGLRRTADALVAMLEREGLATRLLTAADPQVPRHRRTGCGRFGCCTHRGHHSSGSQA